MKRKPSVQHHTPQVCGRFVDDTFVVIKSAHKEEFFTHINSINDGIQFTGENTRVDGSMPFLDTLVIPQADGSLLTTVYRKPLIQTSIYIGIAILPDLLNIGSSIHCSTGLNLSVLPNNSWMKNMKSLQHASVLDGP